MLNGSSLLLLLPIPVALLGIAWYPISPTLPVVAFAVQYIGLPAATAALYVFRLGVLSNTLLYAIDSLN